MEQNRNRNRMMGSFGLVRAALAALAITTLAATPHADAQRRPAAAAQASSARAEQASTEGVVNIQTASVEELQRLPGIGPSKAAAIVAQRERSPFRRIEDILRVRGIGRATFRRLRPMLTVTGPTTLVQEAASRRRGATPAADHGEGDAAEEESAD